MNTTKPGCFKYGCIGCLAFLALLLGMMFLAGALQLTSDVDDPKIEKREVLQELPPEPPPASIAPESDRPQVPDVLPLPEAPPKAGAKSGRIVVDIKMADLTISPGPEGQPVRIEADFDTNQFKLDESFTDESQGWVYEVSFGPKVGVLNFAFSTGRSKNRLDLIIPRGHRLEFVGELGPGETNADFGGLWLERLDLDLKMGEHFIEFREPLPFAMSSMRVDGSMGSVELRGIGNASPQTFDVHHTMGELLVDLAGPWRRNAELSFDFAMGACKLWVPRTAQIDVRRASVVMGEKQINLDSTVAADAPTLTLEVSGKMGELQIEQ